LTVGHAAEGDGGDIEAGISEFDVAHTVLRIVGLERGFCLGPLYAPRTGL
jgi:hypothetical protein